MSKMEESKKIGPGPAEHARRVLTKNVIAKEIEIFKEKETEPRTTNKKALAIDFDGVIHGYSKGWLDGTIYDHPILGAKEALEELSKEFRIIIYSTRNYDRIVQEEHQANQVVEMEKWLAKHDIPYDEIHTKPDKPICKLFIDDNAYRFEGDWTSSLLEIQNLLAAGGER